MDYISAIEKEEIIKRKESGETIESIANDIKISLNKIDKCYQIYLVQKAELSEQYHSRILYFNNHPNELKAFPEILLIHDKTKVQFTDSGRGRKPLTNKIGLKFSNFLTYNHVYTYEYILNLIKTFFISSGLYTESKKIKIPSIHNNLVNLGYDFISYQSIKQKYKHLDGNKLSKEEKLCYVTIQGHTIVFFIGNKTYFIIVKSIEKLDIVNYLDMVVDFRINYERCYDNCFYVAAQKKKPFHYEKKPLGN